MNILITGIHGFVGKNLTKTLRTNHSIYGLDIVYSAEIGLQKSKLFKVLLIEEFIGFAVKNKRI